MHFAPTGYESTGNQTNLQHDVGSSRSAWTSHANGSNSTTVSRESYESQFDLTAAIESIDQEPMASGGFASVHVARCNGSKVALKVIRVIRDSMPTAQRRLTREIHVWKTLDHENIAPLLGVASCPHLSQLAAMITPWYKNGSAMEYLRRERLTYGSRLALAIGVARGLQYLHTLNPVIVHADLKPSNILIDDQRRPKICDFGLARIMSEVGTGMSTTTRHNATPLYAAPEILMAPDDGPAFEPTPASDVYSLGSLVYEFLTESLPYHNMRTNTQVLVAVVKGDKPGTRPLLIENMTERLQWNLFESCWEPEPKDRPDIHQVVAKLKTIGQEYGKQGLPPRPSRSIGTLVVVVLQAKNLLDRRTIGKQDPYCTVELHGHTKRTKAIKRGGQHPEWDEEFRFELFEDDGTLNSQSLLPPSNDRSKKIKGGTRMKLLCHADHTFSQKLVGEAEMDIAEALTKGEIDEWLTLRNGNMYAGEVFLELTFWANEKPVEKKRAHSSTRDIGRRAGQSSRAAEVPRNTSHKPLTASRSLPSLKPKNQPISEPPPPPLPPRPLLPVTQRYRSPSPFDYQQANSYLPSYGAPVQPHHDPNNGVGWPGYGATANQPIAQDSLPWHFINPQVSQGPQNHSNPFSSFAPTPYPDAVGAYPTGPAPEDPYSQYRPPYRHYYMTS